MEKDFVLRLDSLRPFVKGSGPIIVVDDDEDQTFIIEKSYERAGKGNPIVTLSNAEQLLEFMDRVEEGEEEMPELILLDINMPGMNGFQALRQVRSHHTFEKWPPIIMLTASSADRDKETAYKFGASGFWTKPASLYDYIRFFTMV